MADTNYPTLTPYLIVNDAAGLLDFLKNVFGATERMRQMREDGKTIMHAEVQINDAVIMIAEATEQFKAMPAMLYLTLEATDTYYRKGLEAGARAVEEPADQPYGHRRAAFADNWGNEWYVASDS